MAPGIPQLIFLTFLVAVHVLRLPYQWKSRRNHIVLRRVTAQERALVAGIAIGMLVLPLTGVLTPWLRFADYSPPYWFPLAGLALIAPTLFLFWRSHEDLGRHWSATLEMHEEHTLVSHGVYAAVRHPMYAAAWLWVFLQALLIPNYLSGLSGLITFGWLYFSRIKTEEAMLRERFAEEYDAYASRTGRLFPYVPRDSY